MTNAQTSLTQYQNARSDEQLAAPSGGLPELDEPRREGARHEPGRAGLGDQLNTASSRPRAADAARVLERDRPRTSEGHEASSRTTRTRGSSSPRRPRPRATTRPRRQRYKQLPQAEPERLDARPDPRADQVADRQVAPSRPRQQPVRLRPDTRDRATSGGARELRHQDRAAERRDVRHLARGRGRPVHRARVQAAAAGGDRAGRQGGHRRLQRHDLHRLDHPRRPRRRREAAALERRPALARLQRPQHHEDLRDHRPRPRLHDLSDPGRGRLEGWGRRAGCHPHSAALGSAESRSGSALRCSRRAAARAASRRARPDVANGQKLFTGAARAPPATRSRPPARAGRSARTSTTRSAPTASRASSRATIENVVLDQIRLGRRGTAARRCRRTSSRPGRAGRRRLRRLRRGHRQRDDDAAGAARKRRQGDLQGRLLELPHAQGRGLDRARSGRTSTS